MCDTLMDLVTNCKTFSDYYYFLNAASWMLLKSPLIQTCCLSEGRRGNVRHTEQRSSSNSS